MLACLPACLPACLSACQPACPPICLPNYGCLRAEYGAQVDAVHARVVVHVPAASLAPGVWWRDGQRHAQRWAARWVARRAAVRS
eukprot:scaffold63894_cov59-Phaeocystis_antarctica.AAC.1